MRRCADVRHSVCQLCVDAQTSGIVLLHEVGEGHHIYGLDIIVPVITLLTLPDNGLRRIEEHTFPEVWMFAVLHLHDNLLACSCLAEDVVDGRLVAVEERRLLLVKELQIGNRALAFKQCVQEVKQAGLGELLSEDNLEAHIREWVDEFRHN